MPKIRHQRKTVRVSAPRRKSVKVNHDVIANRISVKKALQSLGDGWEDEVDFDYHEQDDIKLLKEEMESYDDDDEDEEYRQMKSLWEQERKLFDDDEDVFRFTFIEGMPRSGKTYFASNLLADLRRRLQMIGCDFGGKFNNFILVCSNFSKQLQDGNFSCLAPFFDFNTGEPIKDEDGKPIIEIVDSLSKDLLDQLDDRIRYVKDYAKPTILIADDAGSEKSLTHGGHAKGSVMGKWVRKSRHFNVLVVIIAHQWMDVPRPVRQLSDRAIIFSWAANSDIENVRKQLWPISDLEAWKKYASNLVREDRINDHPYLDMRRVGDPTRRFRYCNDKDGEKIYNIRYCV